MSNEAEQVPQPVAETNQWNEPLNNFEEGQWWVLELDNAAKALDATGDLKRAVAVVHRMLRSASASIAAPAPQAAKALRRALADLEQASAFHSKKARDRHAETLSLLRAALAAPQVERKEGEFHGLDDAQRGEIAYQLTRRLVIDMPTARAAVDAALGPNARLSG